MKKKRSITGMGMFFFVALGIIMVVYTYNRMEGDAFHRIFEGLARFGIAFIGTGAFYLVLFVAFYAATKLSDLIFCQEEDKEEDLMNYFTKISNPVFIICYVVSYIVALLGR